jgi:hypothetical protein
MGDSGGGLLAVVLWGVGLISLYWVVRGAVRGGIEDAWKRRAQRERPPSV